VKFTKFTRVQVFRGSFSRRRPAEAETCDGDRGSAPDALRA